MRTSEACNAADGAPARAVAWLLLFGAPLVWSPWTVETFEIPKYRLLLLAAILLAALRAAGVTRWRLGPAMLMREVTARLRDPVTLGLILFLASAAASTFTSISPRTSVLGDETRPAGLLFFAALACVAVAVRSSFHTPRQIDGLLHAPVLAAGVMAVYGLAQGARLDPLPWASTTHFAEVLRPFATVGHPNNLAAVLAMTVPLAAHLAVRDWRLGCKRRTALFLTILALAGLASLTTLSRGGNAALGVGTLVFAALAVPREQRRTLLAVCCAATLLFGGALLPALERLPSGAAWTAAGIERLEGIADPRGRLAIWRAATAILRENPVLGCGLDAFGLAFPGKRDAEYWRLADWNVTPTRAHNDLLQLGATQGAFGLLAAAFLMGAVALRLKRAWRVVEPEDRSLVAAVASALAGFGVQGLFGFTVTPVALLAVTLAACGVSLAAPRATADGGVPAIRKTGPPLARALVWTAALGLAWALVFRPLAADAASVRGLRLRATDLRRSIDEQRTAVALDPTRIRPRRALAEAALAAARLEPSAAARAALQAGAVRSLEEALALEPRDPYAHMLLGRALAARVGSTRSALDPAYSRFERALALDENNANLYVAAGHAAIEARDWPRARRYAERLVGLYPTFASGHYHLGFVALQRGELEESERRLRAALALEWHGQEQSGRSGAALALSMALRRLGRLDEAARFEQFAAEHDRASDDPRRQHALLRAALAR